MYVYMEQGIKTNKKSKNKIKNIPVDFCTLYIQEQEILEFFFLIQKKNNLKNSIMLNAENLSVVVVCLFIAMID